MIVKTEDKYCITFQIILSERLYEQLVQNHMHLFVVHVSIIILLASILWQVRDQSFVPWFRYRASLVKGYWLWMHSPGYLSGVRWLPS